MPSSLVSSQFPHFKRSHAKRLREVYRSAGWPFQDVVEIELLAAGLLARVADARGVDCMRVTDAGLAFLAEAAHGNRQAMSAHNTLVDHVAQSLRAEGRVVYTGLSLRARLQVDALEEGGASAHKLTLGDDLLEGAGDEPGARAVQWRLCIPDVFSIRNTSRAAYLEPVVHEIKVTRADLLGDLKVPDKRQAYLELGGQCWYVLGCTAKGLPIAQADEVPAECGVMLFKDGRLEVLRLAPKRVVEQLPFDVWMALAKSVPVVGNAERAQQGLVDAAPTDPS